MSRAGGKRQSNRADESGEKQTWPAGAWSSLVVVLLLAAYMLLFLGVELPSLGAVDAEGHAWRRVDFLVWLLTPATLLKGLAEQWLGQPAAIGIVDRLPIAAVALAVWLLATALGYVALRRLNAAVGLGPVEQLTFSFGVGIALLSTITLLFGLLGWLTSPLPWALVAAVVFAEVGRVWKNRLLAPHDFADQVKGTSLSEPVGRATGEGPASGRNRGQVGMVSHVVSRLRYRRPAELVLGGLCLVFGLVILLGGMLPPIEFDVREYHLQVPKEFFQQQRITFLPHNVYGNMPLGAEMSVLLSMVVCDDWWLGALAGKTVMATFAIATAVLLWTAGRRWFSPLTGTAAAMIYLSTPWVARVSTSGLVEGVLGFFLAAAAYSFWLWRDALIGGPRGECEATCAPAADEEKDDRSIARARLLMCGFFAGAAASVKYTAVPLVVMPLAAAVVALRSCRDRRVGRLVVFLLAASVACGGWYAKNWVLSGNPTYPLLYDWFDGRTRTPEKNAQWVAAHRPPGYTFGLWTDDVQRLFYRSEWISPLAMPLALLAVVVGAGQTRVRQCWLYVGVYWAIWWLFTHRLDRFWVPVLPLLSLAAGVGYAWHGNRPWRWALGALVALGVVYCLLVDVSGPGGYNRFLVRLDRLREDPQRVPPWFAYLEEHTPEGEQVLSVGDAALFDLRVPVLYNTVFDTCVFEQLVRDRKPEEIRRNLRSISCIYVHWGEIARYRSPGNYGFTDFVRPEVFDHLVRVGILDPPIDEFENAGVQIFPVRHAGKRPFR